MNIKVLNAATYSVPMNLNKGETVVCRWLIVQVECIDHNISYNLWELAYLGKSQGKNSPNLYMKGKARVTVKLLLNNKQLKV